MHAPSRPATAPVIDSDAGTIRIGRVGVPEPLVTFSAPAGQRLRLHPLRAPDGGDVLSEDAPAHHPWQHGLYTGLNDVGGVGFWTEGLKPERIASDGGFRPLPLAAPRCDGGAVRFGGICGWTAPDGRTLLVERQDWIFTDHGGWWQLDLDWRLEAAGAPVPIGRSDYGGLFLRVPWRAEVETRLLTADGVATQAEAEGGRTAWVAVALGLPRGLAGLALFDHPRNDGHPLPWRVDGQFGLGPARSRLGPWVLPADGAVRFRHRVVAFCGAPDARFLAARATDFATT